MPDKKKNRFSEPSLSVEELSKALYEVNRKLDNTIRQRNELFANISHDLRSPITAIHNSIEYLQSLDHISDDDIQSVLPLLYERTLVLEKMINDIFLLTKLDASESMLNLREVSLYSFLENYYTSIYSDKLHTGRNLNINLSALSVHTAVLMDSDYLKRVLDNLYTNALKFTNSGDQIELSAFDSLHGTHLSVPSAVFAIKDTGLGISSKDILHIFERAYTASTARTPSDHSGSGLGLSICQSIVQKHNGTIWCESQGSNMGSCFFIEIPII